MTPLTGDVAIAPVAGPVWPMKGWAYYDQLKAELERTGLRVNFLPRRNSLLEHMGDVSNHRCLVGGDSLPMHFALGTGTPCVTLFNCTSPWEIYDYGLQTKLVSPLLERFFYKRDFDTAATTAIRLDDVFDAVMERLKKPRRSPDEATRGGGHRVSRPRACRPSDVVSRTQEAVRIVFPRIVEVCLDAVQQGHKLLFFGNGGSAADAQHLATELVVRYQKDRPAMCALALTTDTSALTAIGNDFGFDELFARQVEGGVQRRRRGDRHLHVRQQRERHPRPSSCQSKGRCHRRLHRR